MSAAGRTHARHDSAVCGLDDSGPASRCPGCRAEAGPTAPPGPVPSRNGHVAEPPLDAHLTDLGNAQRLVADHGEDLRYCHPWRKWLVWDGRRWRPDDTGEAARRAKKTILGLFRWATTQINAIGKLLEETPDSDELKAKLAAAHKVQNWCLKSEDARRLNALLELARSEPGIPVVPDELNRHPYLLNARNGTLDLRTGELRPHRREDYLTQLCPVDYDPELRDEDCSLWLGSLDRWLAGNEQLVAYLQRALGYCLTGDVSEQCLWFLHGAGANGKSTFLLTLLALLGDYGGQAVSELLMARAHDAHPTERADLFGKRLVATIETDQGKRLAESLMKQLTGGDVIKVRRMREDFWDLHPTHKLFLAANHRPTIRGTDHAVWRRIKLVPFTVTIPDAEKDPHLSEKLKAELPAILAWAVRGCLEWQAGGMCEPREVTDATNAYRQEQDSISKFLAECCNRHNDLKVRSSALLDAYTKWSGEKLTANAFAALFQEKGYGTKMGGDGCKYWLGIGLTPMEES